MNETEAVLTGMLASTDKPEIRLRRNMNGKYSARCYSNNRVKTAHGVGDTIIEAIADMMNDRGSGGKK